MNAKNMSSYKTLADLLESRGTLAQDQILTLLKPVMTAVIQLHKQNRVHGHICPETIILHDNSLLFFCCPLPKSYQKLLQTSASKNGLNMTASLAADVLNWKIDFQFAKVNTCSWKSLQEQIPVY